MPDRTATTTIHELHDAQARRIDAWARVFVGLIVLALIGLLGRVLQIKLAPDPRLLEAAGITYSSHDEVNRRGDLVDRAGRVIATSSIGYRLFVDPALVEDPLTIAGDLGHMLGLDPARIDRLITEHADRRYVVVRDLLEDWQVERVRHANLRGVGLEERLVRHYPHGNLAAGVVGRVGFEHTGQAGFEYIFDDAMTPTHGSMTWLRDVHRRTLWIEPDHYRRGTDGKTVQLSIDLVIQDIAERRLRHAVQAYNAGGGRVVVADPRTGEILAMCEVLNPRDGWDEYTDDPMRNTSVRLGRNRCVTDPYEPGSTFKPFIWATATELGMAELDEVLPTPNSTGHVTSQGRRIKDAHYYGPSTWRRVLVKSMNSGMAIVAERMTSQQMQQAVARFGFGQRTNCGFPGEAWGIVTDPADWSHYSQTSVAMGHEIAVTPLQMIRAFSVFCRDGTIPFLRITAANSPPEEFQFAQRVLSAETTRTTRLAMRDVMTDGTGRKAQSTRYRLFGKSGTAQLPRKDGGGYHDERFVSSFIAGAPLDDPRLVVICVIDDPDASLGETWGDSHHGGKIAGPVVRDIMDEALGYLGVPPDISQPGLASSR